MKDQLAIQTLLRRKLVEIQKQNPRYSLRSYAQKVGVNAGALSYILNGKRNVSRKLAERIMRRLMLDPQQRAELLALFPKKRSYTKSEAGEVAPEPRYLELSASQFYVAAEWEHFAVLSLIRCNDFSPDIEWIASRLGIREARAQQVLDRLKKLELLHEDDKGQLFRSTKSYRTTDDVADLAMKKHHEQTLDLAKESLHRDPVLERDFTTLTMPIDKKKLGAAKELIRQFQDDLSSLLESGQLTDVYRLSVQLFPLSKLKAGERP